MWFWKAPKCTRFPFSKNVGKRYSIASCASRGARGSRAVCLAREPLVGHSITREPRVLQSLGCGRLDDRPHSFQHALHVAWCTRLACCLFGTRAACRSIHHTRAACRSIHHTRAACTTIASFTGLWRPGSRLALPGRQLNFGRASGTLARRSCCIFQPGIRTSHSSATSAGQSIRSNRGISSMTVTRSSDRRPAGTSPPAVAADFGWCSV